MKDKSKCTDYFGAVPYYLSSTLLRFTDPGEDNFIDEPADISLRIGFNDGSEYVLPKDDLFCESHAKGYGLLRFLLKDIYVSDIAVIYFNDVIIYTTDINYYRTSVDIPADLIYKFDGVTVKPEWCSFDGMNLYVRSTVTYENGIPENAENDIILTDSVNDSISSGEITFTDGNTVTRTDRLFYRFFSVPYPVFVTAGRFNSAEYLKYINPEEAYLPLNTGSIAVLYETPGIGVPIYSDKEISEEAVVDLLSMSVNAAGFEYDTDDPASAAFLKNAEIEIISLDGVSMKYTSRNVDMFSVNAGKTCVRYITGALDPNSCETIKINGVTVFGRNSKIGYTSGMTNNTMQYRVNENGQTYGSSAGRLPSEYPDLVRVEGVNGTVGYVYADELEEEPPSSPEEAVRRQRERDADPEKFRREINVYDTDGETVLDTFIIG